MTYEKRLFKNSVSEKRTERVCAPANLQNPVNPGFKGKSFKMRNAVQHYKDEKDLGSFMCYVARCTNAEGHEGTLSTRS